MVFVIVRYNDRGQLTKCNPFSSSRLFWSKSFPQLVGNVNFVRWNQRMNLAHPVVYWGLGRCTIGAIAFEYVHTVFSLWCSFDSPVLRKLVDKQPQMLYKRYATSNKTKWYEENKNRCTQLKHEWTCFLDSTQQWQTNWSYRHESENVKWRQQNVRCSNAFFSFSQIKKCSFSFMLLTFSNQLKWMRWIFVFAIDAAEINPNTHKFNKTNVTKQWTNMKNI